MKRPLSVTLIGWLYIAAGLAGVAYHLTDLHPPRSFADEEIWVLLIRVLAVVSGIYLLLGKDWARWLAVAWIAYHLALSTFHAAGELAMHAVFFVVIAFVLFRRPASRYFRPESGRATGA